MPKQKKKTKVSLKINKNLLIIAIVAVFSSLTLSFIFTKISSAQPDYTKSNYSGTVGEYCGNECWLGNPNDKLVINTNDAFQNCTPPFDSCPGAQQSIKVNGQTNGGSGNTLHYTISWVSADICSGSDTPQTNGDFCLYPHFQVTVTKGDF